MVVPMSHDQSLIRSSIKIVQNAFVCNSMELAWIVRDFGEPQPNTTSLWTARTNAFQLLVKIHWSFCKQPVIVPRTPLPLSDDEQAPRSSTELARPVWVRVKVFRIPHNLNSKRHTNHASISELKIVSNSKSLMPTSSRKSLFYPLWLQLIELQPKLCQSQTNVRWYLLFFKRHGSLVPCIIHLFLYSFLRDVLGCRCNPIHGS